MYRKTLRSFNFHDYLGLQAKYLIDCVFLSYHICVYSESTLCNQLNVKELLAEKSAASEN